MNTVAISTNDMTDIGTGMSNFDGLINDGFAEELKARAGEVYGRHAGLGFNGRVYYYDGLFYEDVWVYGCKRCTMRADTLEDLMNYVCEEFGRD